MLRHHFWKQIAPLCRRRLQSSISNAQHALASESSAEAHTAFVSDTTTVPKELGSRMRRRAELLEKRKIESDHSTTSVSANQDAEPKSVVGLHSEPEPEPEPEEPYWDKIPRWKHITKKEFLDYTWQTSNSVQTPKKLFEFLNEVLPQQIPTHSDSALSHIKTPEDFIQDVKDGMEIAPMAVRMTPHILSLIDWDNPLKDPMRRQFLPMKSAMLPDHPQLTLDSLHETDDSIADGLIMRYPDKALFLATSVCPLYCRFCTRSYAVGGNTQAVEKKSYKPTARRWNEAIEKMKEVPTLNDIVISGGDSFYLPPAHLMMLGERILDIPHIRRIRFASKGLAVCPSRFLDENDDWTKALIHVSEYGRKKGKSVAMHTHFNHHKEISWITRKASQKLFEAGVTVRNQAVLLKGVNDDLPTMKKLLRDLAYNNILPYYVYQGDMVKGVEDLRTPLQTILDLESHLRGTIAGFLMPSFVVDLPGGGGKRLASSHESYDKTTGISTFTAPGIKGGDRVYEYYDPLWSVPKVAEETPTAGHWSNTAVSGLV